MNDQVETNTNKQFNPFNLIAILIVVGCCACFCLTSCIAFTWFSTRDSGNPFSTAFSVAAADGSISLSEITQEIEKAAANKIPGEELKRSYYFSSTKENKVMNIVITTETRKSNPQDFLATFNIFTTQGDVTNTILQGKALMIGNDAFVLVEGDRNQSTDTNLKGLVDASKGQWVKVSKTTLLPVLIALSANFAKTVNFDTANLQGIKGLKLQYNGANSVDGKTCYTSQEKIGDGIINACESKAKVEIKWASPSSTAFMSIEQNNKPVDLTPPAAFKTLP